MPDDDLYDNYDADPRENSGDEKDDGDYGEEFLAPKSAFAGKNLEVGAVHKVRIESIQDSEVVLKCIKSEDKEKAVSESDNDEDDMYS